MEKETRQSFSFIDFESSSPLYSKHKIISAEDMKEHPFDQSIKPINVDDIVEKMINGLWEFIEQERRKNDQARSM